MPEMTRRDVVQGIVALFGGATLLDVDGFLARYAEPARAGAARNGVGPFSPADVVFLDEVADTILPGTSTPGAKAASTGAFMALMVTDTYSDEHQAIFREGMTALDEASRNLNGVGFLKAAPAQRLTLLESVDREQHEYTCTKAAEQPPHYFHLMKGLAMQGYFTSEVGYTQAMRYLETPGRYDPCAPHAPGEKIWASHA